MTKTHKAWALHRKICKEAGCTHKPTYTLSVWGWCELCRAEAVKQELASPDDKRLAADLWGFDDVDEYERAMDRPTDPELMQDYLDGA